MSFFLFACWLCVTASPFLLSLLMPPKFLAPFVCTSLYDQAPLYHFLQVALAYYAAKGLEVLPT